jgi:aspartate-semialdehyde dehydrogenase
MSKELGDLVVKNCTPEEFKDHVDVVFSGLDSDVAGDAGEKIFCRGPGSTEIQGQD